MTANMPIKIAAYRLAKSKSWSFTDEDEAIRYHESNGTLALNLTTQDYGYSDCIRFGYYLEGYDEDWRETLVGESSLTYVSLPPGHYVLHLKATDRDGHWTDKEMAVTVRVVPYFYKSVWFWELSSCFCAGKLRILPLQGASFAAQAGTVGGIGLGTYARTGSAEPTVRGHGAPNGRSDCRENCFLHQYGT